MEARRRSGRGARLQGGGGGTVGGPTDVHKIQEYMCNTLCSGVSVGVVVFLCVFFLFRSVSCVPAFLRILPLVS